MLQKQHTFLRSKEEYETRLNEIRSRTDLSPVQRRMAVNSLTRRYENDTAYFTPDETGYSQSDRDALKAFREDLVWKARKLGMSKDEAEASSNEILSKYIRAQELLGRKIVYDESEIGAPDRTRQNSAKGEE